MAVASVGQYSSVAHELAHTLGADHDVACACPEPCAPLAVNVFYAKEGMGAAIGVSWQQKSPPSNV